MKKVTTQNEAKSYTYGEIMELHETLNRIKNENIASGNFDFMLKCSQTRINIQPIVAVITDARELPEKFNEYQKKLYEITSEMCVKDEAGSRLFFWYEGEKLMSQPEYKEGSFLKWTNPSEYARKIEELKKEYESYLNANVEVDKVVSKLLKSLVEQEVVISKLKKETKIKATIPDAVFDVLYKYQLISEDNF